MAGGAKPKESSKNYVKVGGRLEWCWFLISLKRILMAANYDAWIYISLSLSAEYPDNGHLIWAPLDLPESICHLYNVCHLFHIVNPNNQSSLLYCTGNSSGSCPCTFFWFSFSTFGVLCKDGSKERFSRHPNELGIASEWISVGLLDNF